MHQLLSRLLLSAALLAPLAQAAELRLELPQGNRSWSTEQLLGHPQAQQIEIAADVAYKRAMTYRAVPLIALVGDVSKLGFDTIEARASDGFVSQIPVSLVMQGASGGSVAWIAIEEQKAPWPNLAKQQKSAGPFYLVWENPERSNVGSEQWPFALAKLTGAENPVIRWPQLALDPALPADAKERLGQAAFLKNCIPCHRLNGAGESDTGPDLGRPMNVTAYMTPAGLHALIRDPKAVRTWPAQQMIGFGPEKIPDADIDALIAFLAYTAKR